jgi:hypothetical protein
MNVPRCRASCAVEISPHAVRRSGIGAYCARIAPAPMNRAKGQICAHRDDQRNELPAGKNPMFEPYASPAIRDQFLVALDADDRALSTELARNLINCANPLPGMTRDQLGLPVGSTYGCAARRVLLLYSKSE